MEGNQMKMREALVAVQKKIEHLCGSFNVPNSLVAGRMEINGIINAALSGPPRNCDVGTPEEQKARMLEYCKSHKNVDGIIICERCPHHGPNWTWCALRWAQTPYEAQEGGAE